MYYLLTQILVSLLFTAALGVIAGWLLRGLSFRSQVAQLERERDEQAKRATALAERLEAVAREPQRSRDEARVAPAPPRPDPKAGEALTVMRERLAQLDGVARSQAERIAELGQRLREKDALLESLQQTREKPAPAPRLPPRRPNGEPPGGLLQQRPGETDRLQSISGIGPVLERVLNEIGIYRFDQLARLTPDNVEWLAARIDWFPQRILREDWVGQARRLHNEAHPDEPL
jgi:NADH-quinone oxidoreductase subunit E